MLKTAGGKKYYDILNIDRNSTEDEIKKAYKRMALKYHPDRNTDIDAEDKFKEISIAYQILSDVDKKKKYDLYGDTNIEDIFQNNTMHFDIFNNLFGDLSKSFGTMFENTKNKDRIIDLNIPLEILYQGHRKHIKFKKRDKCAHCLGTGAQDKRAIYQCNKCFGMGHITTTQQMLPGMIQQIRNKCNLCGGNGKLIDPTQICKMCQGNKIIEIFQTSEIHIQAGMDNNDTIRIDNGGDIENINQIPGDLIFKINAIKHPEYNRYGPHLHIIYKITLLEALTKTTIHLNHPNNTKFKIEIMDMVINPETVLEIKNLGMPYLDKPDNYGNLYISFNIIFPKNLSDKRQYYLQKILPIPKEENENTTIRNNINDYQISNIVELNNIKKEYQYQKNEPPKTHNKIPNNFFTEQDMLSTEGCIQQ